MSLIKLSRITIYPIKALPGVAVGEAVLTAQGSLAHDREYALVDHALAFVNGKRHARIHALDAACAIDHGAVRVTLRSGARGETFVLGDAAAPRDVAALEARFTQYFGEPVTLERNSAGGFPDDTDNPGPTLIAEASYAEVANWFPGQTIDQLRGRFRANLEIAGCPAFWEDQLFGDAGAAVAFRIGEVEFLGTNPCKRCVVPTRDPATGDEWPGFQRTFVQRRKATLPAWANASRFDFYYRLSINTRARGNQAGKVIRVGDAVELL